MSGFENASAPGSTGVPGSTVVPGGTSAPGATSAPGSAGARGGPGAVSLAARPAIARRYRLQWEAAQDAHVLLYPEGMIKLNGSAGAILTRCDGMRTVGEIVADLEKSFGTTGLSGDVVAFVGLAIDRGWLEAAA